MGRNQVAALVCLQQQFKQVAGIKAKNRMAVGFYIADFVEYGRKPFNRRQVREKQQVVIFTGLSVVKRISNSKELVISPQFRYMFVVLTIVNTIYRCYSPHAVTYVFFN